MKSLKAQLELDLKASLGEGPIWHEAQQRLYFVDIDKARVHTFDPETKSHQQWITPLFPSALFPQDGDQVLVAAHQQIISLDTTSGKWEPFQRLPIGKQDIRFNEGKMDRSGRLWLGTMQVDARQKAGAFYCLDTNGELHSVLDKLSVPNGFCWSQDQEYMYHIDSLEKTVCRYRYQEDRLQLSDRKVVLDFTDGEALPDGMCMDQRGNLWIAFWGGYRVGCFNPATGEQIAEVSVPAPHVTSCTIGGPDQNQLFITTARYGMSDEQLEAYPLSGGLFSVKFT
ncbi:SMP-30/gluconolactonase/LRE family protein [Marinoscillum furvescens]|uniref:Regucalcin n=1 Tax=Marinoscillum furvescens DSM 4134 TaxID=1122208 RepID=A0A3D9L958_MARFU|nr:SMP-30/gluconolactonase/LRE family protein [Marinoscillum furvescens]REE02206.1 sugar lactone lactonase YvrE [Marinoscillum furvescens DSM 4134]